MSKIICEFLIIFFLGIFLSYKTFALDDGIYTGVYNTFYAHPESDSKKGDKGVFEFTVKNNKILKLFAYDYPNWKFFKIKPNFTIDPKTDELRGFASGSDIARNAIFKINMRGIFIGKKFAGEGNVELTSPYSLIIEKFVFESVN